MYPTMADTQIFNMFRENGACQFLMKRLEKKLMEDNYLVNISFLLLYTFFSWFIHVWEWQGFDNNGKPVKTWAHWIYFLV